MKKPIDAPSATAVLTLLRLGLFVVAISCLAIAPTQAMAAEPSEPTTAAVGDLPVEESAPGLSLSDNTWMLLSSALVLFMTAPGLAMFYSGLVRKKNVIGVMMQCVFLMGLMTIVWALWGYSFAFGGSGGYFGNFEFIALQNVQLQWAEGQSVVPMEGSIPRLAHMLFQGMFFIITPALICGAFAERMKFSAMVVFMVLWGTLVYCPLCHWVWDSGILAYGTESAKISAGGALDFAGGTVVHISSGVSALICALAWAAMEWITRAVSDMAEGSPLGLIEGGSVIVGQIVATAVTWVFASVATFILLKIIDATMGLRISEADEIEGLDLSQHGEEGYIVI